MSTRPFGWIEILLEGECAEKSSSALIAVGTKPLLVSCSVPKANIIMFSTIEQRTASASRGEI